MKEIDELLEVVDSLLGPDGCPWDRQQTTQSCRTYLLEEACELIEAIDLDDNTHIKEELGDLFFLVLFLGRIAEKEQRCTMADALSGIKEKLVRRHPHVFGEVHVETPEQVLEQWERIKKQEKEERKSALDGIPKGLPALARAYKAAKRMAKAHFPGMDTPEKSRPFDTEEQLGNALFSLVLQAKELGIDPEHALRKTLAEKEEEFRRFEQDKR